MTMTRHRNPQIFLACAQAGRHCAQAIHSFVHRQPLIRSLAGRPRQRRDAALEVRLGDRPITPGKHALACRDAQPGRGHQPGGATPTSNRLAPGSAMAASAHPDSALLFRAVAAYLVH